jgi:hypothetical protein
MAKRTRRKKGSPLQSMMNEMQENGDLQNQKVLVNPPGEAKMSGMITELIEPYRASATNRASYHNLIALACIAWNTANLPQEERLGNISEALNQLPVATNEMRLEMTRLILELVKRKVALFPDNQRVIVNFKINESKDNYHLGVASMPGPKQGDPDFGSL